jgi:ATP-dependent Clp protease adapter protein ClpS
VAVFRKEAEEALRLTQEVHDTGSALITVTSQERAELYVEQVRSLARPRGFPLVASIEPA